MVGWAAAKAIRPSTSSVVVGSDHQLTARSVLALLMRLSSFWLSPPSVFTAVELSTTGDIPTCALSSGIPIEPPDFPGTHAIQPFVHLIGFVELLFK
jgi:hypothetical protein